MMCTSLFLFLIFYFNLFITSFILLLSVAFLVLCERKILSLAQIRKSPNIVGYYSLVQTVFDSVKLLTKQSIFNNKYFYYLYDVMPLMFMCMSLISWLILSSYNSNFNYSFSFLFLVLISLLMMFPSLWSSWGSNSVFTSLSSMRGVAQMCSYDIIFMFLIMLFLILNFSFNISSYNLYLFNNMFNIFVLILWYLSCLAELNRTPFDLLEGESELVSSFNTEFSSSGFTLLFMSEYLMLWLLISFVTSSLLFSGDFQMMNLLVSFMLTFSSIFIRASYPRMKFNEIIELLWFSLIFIVLVFLMMFL